VFFFVTIPRFQGCLCEIYYTGSLGLADGQGIQVGNDYGLNYCRLLGAYRHHHLFLRRSTGRRHGGDGKFLVVCFIFSDKKICQIK